MNISPEQVIILGFIAAGLGQALKLGVAWFGVKLERNWLTVALFALSILIAYFWAAPNCLLTNDVTWRNIITVKALHKQRHNGG